MAKRSRRARRQESQKSKQQKVTTPAPVAEAPVVVAEVTAPTAPKAEAAPPPSRKSLVDFTHEYYYVYSEIRSFLLIVVLMFVLMAGLSFVI